MYNKYFKNTFKKNIKTKFSIIECLQKYRKEIFLYKNYYYENMMNVAFKIN